MGFDLELLDGLANEGWLRRARHPDADLYLYNYTERCQFERHWTPETLACRGLIVDLGGNVVARPFGKFFNLGETGAPELPVGEQFTATEKIDGSLGIAYRLDDEWRLATRGSFTSPQAQEGTRMLADYELYCARGVTPLFEIVFPENRIVVNYGDARELVLLANIDHETGRERSPPSWSGPEVTRHLHLATHVEQLRAQSRPNAEGWVVHYPHSNVRFKVKFDEYVRLHRIISGINRRHVWEALRAGQDPLAELDGIPDETYKWIEDTAGALMVDHDQVARDVKNIFVRRPATPNRGEVARYFQREAQKSGVPVSSLFAMLDGKPHDDMIWKAIRPEAQTPRDLIPQ